MLAQRGEIIRSADHPGYRSAFRASNLQGALELLEELQRTPVDYQPQSRKPDRKGQSECPTALDRLSRCSAGLTRVFFYFASWSSVRCYPVMPAELAWLFATRPAFLYPELLPCANLDPAMYCPRRTAAFTAAEDW